MRILAISGSLRDGSLNTSVARAATEVAPAGATVDVFEGIGLLPFYEASLDTESAAAPVVALREAITQADALLLVTPEYNGSIPGVLKNAVDWASRPHRASALSGKTVALASASPGSYGAMWAQEDLRRVLGVAGARVIEGGVSVPRAATLVDADGRLADDAVRRRLAELLQALVAAALPVATAA